MSKKTTRKFIIPKDLRIANNHTLTTVLAMEKSSKDVSHFINYKDHSGRRIEFTIQDGPIKKVGVNGCQVDDLIKSAGFMVSSLNNAFPCEENKEAMFHLAEALEALNKRKKDREKRGVEGTDQA